MYYFSFVSKVNLLLIFIVGSSDSTVIVWSEYCNEVPSPNQDFVEIAMGGYHALGLKADGWGRDNFSQSTVPNSLNSEFIGKYITAMELRKIHIKSLEYIFIKKPLAVRLC